MRLFIFTLIIITFNACYSFRGIFIGDEETFYVETFDLRSPDAPPTVGVTFRDELVDKVRNNSRLNYVDKDPDLEFSGTITRYTVSPIAPEPGERSAINRLDITVEVDFVNNLVEENSWKQNFSFFFDFDSDINLLDIQDTAIEAINEQLMEDIFNKAFTNW